MITYGADYHSPLVWRSISDWNNNIINNMENITGVMTSEHVMEEKVFNTVKDGVYSFINNEISMRRKELSDTFDKEFENNEVVKELERLKKHYHELQAKHSNLKWYQSEYKIIEAIKAVERRCYLITGIELSYYRDTTPSNYYDSFYNSEFKKNVVLPAWPDKEVVTAKLRLVKNLTDKTFEQLVKIAR